jgi:hypothetical protein
MRLTLMMSFCTLVTACSTRDPNFCPGANPNDNCHEADADATRCTSNAECSAPAAVCDVGGMMKCVQCTAAEDAACTGTTPACGGDNACRACAAHVECRGSDACLPDGKCADPGQVAYVKPPSLGGTDNPSCTFAMPCTKVASALQTGRPYVKLAGTNDEGGTLTIDNSNVTLIAERDAKLIRTSTGIHVEVKGTSQVEIYDLEISGALGASGVGISMPLGNAAKLTLHRAKLLNNAGGGISATGGTLTVSQSTIALNSGDGVEINNTQFDITNTVIARNGGIGFYLILINNGLRRFEFNTVAQNQGPAGITAGVVCAVIATPLELRNSIVYDNGAGLQVEGTNCSWTYSDIGPMAVSGTGNIDAPPMFVNPAQNDFHLQSGTPAKDAADPAASLAIDIDGDARPQGAARDMGADEIR